MRADARKNHDHILAVARTLLAEGGAETSLRDVARTAGVGLGTLYRHFPNREALLEALLRSGFDALTERARALATDAATDAALIAWLRELVALAHDYGGAIKSMVAAIEDETSALHGACVAMKAAGTALLVRAQAAGTARADVTGADLFALVGALAWIHDQPALAPRADPLFAIVARALLTEPAAVGQPPGEPALTTR